MSHLRRALTRFWIVIPICAGAFLLWLNGMRIRRIQAISDVVTESRYETTRSRGSSGKSVPAEHDLILPGRDEKAFHWMLQTEQMLVKHDWRLRRVAYDNAPAGRAVMETSVYRWWLGLIAWIDHAILHRPIEFSIDQCAIWAGPILQLTGVFVLTAFAAWRFGRLSAVLVSIGLTTWFPFTDYYYPALPDDRGLANLCAVGGVALLLAGIDSRLKQKESHSSRWFVASGVLSGIAAWVSVEVELPILIGTCAGATVCAWMTRGQLTGTPEVRAAVLPWRIWAYSGGITMIAAYLIEYAPADLWRWDLEHVHPLYSFAWMGAGELLTRGEYALRDRKLHITWRQTAVAAIALGTIAAIPAVAHFTASSTFLHARLDSTRLGLANDLADAASFPAWLAQNGFTAAVVATTSCLLVGIACVPIMLRSRGLKSAIVAVALGPVLVAGALAFCRLQWWGTFDATLVIAVAAACKADEERSEAKKENIRSNALQPGGASSGYNFSQLALMTAVVGCTVCGCIHIRPPWDGNASLVLTSNEAEQLVERDFARWLRKHTTGDVCLLAPPPSTTALCFFGGFSGIGTLSEDNQAGIMGSVRIVTATSEEEARSLMEARGITHIVLPSWDPFFEEYIQSKFSRGDAAFLTRIDRATPPLWLEPAIYSMPKIAGFQNESIRVYTVVPNQKEAVAMARLVEYWLDTGDIEKASQAERTLRRFPSDVGALVARARVFLRSGEEDSLAKTIDSLVARVSEGGDRFLPWDRRVSLAVLFARVNHIDLAREQLGRCFIDIDQNKLQRLPAAELYQFLGLGHAFGFAIADPSLRQLAVDLLPPALRSRVQ